jgi:hypothetical protein
VEAVGDGDAPAPCLVFTGRHGLAGNEEVVQSPRTAKP